MRCLTMLLLLSCFSAPTLLRAQTACPSSNRLVFFGQVGDLLDLDDGASYTITLGRTSRFNSPGTPLSEQLLSAVVFRNGVCHRASGFGQWFASLNGAPVVNGLPSDANLCLGDGNDLVQVLTTTQVVDCGGTSITVNSTNYGNPGRRLSIYGGGGIDFLLGGIGSDSLYGGEGIDVLSGVSSGNGSPISDDRLFGENGDDVLIASPGTGTLLMSGGSGNDSIDHQCRPATVICGSGTDSVTFAPNPRPFISRLCESWSQSGCP